MKIIKYSFLVLLIGSFASCLKPKNDFAGLREDKGSIVIAIAETQYINSDAQNVGLGIIPYANFSFTTPATEEVKFFTVHVSQPRDNKLSGPLVLKVTMTAHPGSPDPRPPHNFPNRAHTLPPAGAITIPAEISIPASGAASFDVPVKFAVNKSLLNPALWYGATFTITSTNQGVVSDLEKSVDVVFNNIPSTFAVPAAVANTTRIGGRYQWTSTVVDPAGQYGVKDNKKPVNLEETAPNNVDIFDYYAWGLGGVVAPGTSRNLFAMNNLTGASTSFFQPRYVLDASGKVTSVLNQSATASVTNLALDASGANQFTYTANDNKKLEVKYSFTLTTTINGVSTPRTVTVTEKFEYDTIQAYY